MTPKRPLVPWLVGWSDMRRYLGRALDACDRGRAVFFVAPKGVIAGDESRRTLTLVPYRDDGRILEAARKDLKAGRYRRVVLADLPKRPKRQPR